MADKIDTFHPRYCSQDGETVILASREGTKFSVLTSLLKLSSSTFRGMLEMPRIPEESSSDPIQLEEEAYIIAFLLDSIYPTETNPSLREGLKDIKADIFTRVQAIAWTCDKYDMPRALHCLRVAVEDDAYINNALDRYALAPFLQSETFEQKAFLDCSKIDILAGSCLSDEGVRSSVFPRMRADKILELLKEYTRVWRQILPAFRILYCDLDWEVKEPYWACQCKKTTLLAERLKTIYEALATYARGHLAFHPQSKEFLDPSFLKSFGGLFDEATCKFCKSSVLDTDFLCWKLRELNEGREIPDP